MRKKVMRLSRLLMSLLLCLAMIIPAGTAMKAQAATDETSGSLGGNITWNLDVATGKLTIRGNGSTPNYQSGPVLTYSPFKGDARIKSVVIEEGVEVIGSCLFISCPELSSVSLPSSIREIGYSAFSGDTKLTNIELPENVTLKSTFDGAGLTSIVLPRGTKLEGGVFQDCGRLTRVTLPEDLVRIPDNTFRNCVALKTITIPESVDYVGNCAFRGCSNMNSAIILSSTTGFDQAAFYDMSSRFTIVSNKDSAAEAYAIKHGFAFAEIDNYTEPEDEEENITWKWNEATSTLTISGNGAMRTTDWKMASETWNAKNVIIGNGITSIADNAFNSKYKQLSNVKIPNTVTKIGGLAFWGCESLTGIKLPNSVNEIGYKAFEMSGLKSIEIPDGVTTIKQFTFSGCENLESITIPDSVTKIELAAFYNNYYTENYKKQQTLKTVIVHGEPKSAGDFVVESENELFNDATFINEPHDSTKSYCKDYVVPDSSPLSDNFVPETIEEPIVYANSTEDPSSFNCKFYHQGGKSFWYENGVRQGTYDDPKGVVGDGTVRGREIFDAETGAWYWCDSVLDGAKAINKEVWMPYIYQDEKSWSDAEIKQNAAASIDEHADMSAQLERDIKAHTGKWVRYNANGKMFKGWYKVTSSEAQYYPDQVGNIYYYDPKTGLMAKGDLTIDGVSYHFDETTGVLQK